MRNSETRTTKTGPDDAGLFQLFNETRLDERKSCAFAVSIRMEALALHILQKEMNGVEAAELLRREVARYETESRGDWH
ncbi:UNVERIFIED_ORG: FPC/CPF motif-containing protein YcgG [Lelliottia amnigena]|nr:FPC/CPF motif-containing protein YcgG [Lelliottia amnigena]